MHYQMNDHEHDHDSDWPPPPKKKKKRRSWLMPLIFSIVGPMITGVVTLVLFMFIVLALLHGQANPDHAVDEFPELNEIWSCGDGTTKVVRIPVKGVLMRDDSPGPFSTPDPVSTALTQIRAATADPEVRAIIVEIDSPGGGVTASDLIYTALIRFKESGEDRKVIAIMGDIAASGGYYVAAAADHIIAHPTTLTGSIGVIISKLNIKGFGEQYGVGLETIKSGKNKDLLSPFHDMTDEQREILESVVNEMHVRFVNIIAEGRESLSVNDVEKLADGAVFTADAAMKNGLIDEIGYWQETLDRVRELVGAEDIKVYRYSQDMIFSSLLGVYQGAPKITRGRIAELGGMRLTYMWEAW